MPTDIYNMGLQFKQVASQSAGWLALSFEDGTSMSFAELDEASDRAASHLLQSGAQAGSPIAIYAEKSPLTYVAMVAALKIGTPYVVLDTESPYERVDKILQRAEPLLILRDREFNWQQVPSLPLEILSEHAEPIDISIIEAVGAETPSYIMFTSGSTGFPKGVAISHASQLNFCRWARETFAITSEDRLTGVNALYFDNSVFDFTASLFNGACLAPVTRETVQNPKALALAVSRCTIWFSVPSLLIYLTTLRALKPESWRVMRAIIFGGEGFPKAELKKLHTLYNAHTTLWNVYGPTEGTCICSAHAISEHDFDEMDKLAPLGHLAPDFKGAVMNKEGTQEVEKGEVGELFLMGSQVALGYYNDEELTAKAFAKNPLPQYVDEPCYRTGDLVYQDSDTGYYHFAGRKDNQIKHMGYRIELEEIEAALAGMDEVAQAAVIYRKKTHAGSIIAFVAARNIAADELKARLRELLPSYMIPENIHVHDSLPQNANGKVDRKALANEEKKHA